MRASTRMRAALRSSRSSTPASPGIGHSSRKPKGREFTNYTLNLLPANQVLIQGVHVLVGRNQSVDRVSVTRDTAERSRELLAIAGHHEHTQAVFIELDLRDMTFVDQQGRDVRRIAAPNDELAGMLVDFLAHVAKDRKS